MNIEEAMTAAYAAIADLGDAAKKDASDLAWCRRQLDMHASTLHRIRAARVDGDITMLGGSEVEAELSVWMQTEELNTSRADDRVVALTAVLERLTGRDVDAVATHELRTQQWSAVPVDPMADFVAMAQGTPFDETLPAPGSRWVVVDTELRPVFLKGDRETAHMWTANLDEAATFTESEAHVNAGIGSRHERAVTVDHARRLVADHERRMHPVPPSPAENDG